MFPKKLKISKVFAGDSGHSTPLGDAEGRRGASGGADEPPGKGNCKLEAGESGGGAPWRETLKVGRRAPPEDRLEGGPDPDPERDRCSYYLSKRGGYFVFVQ